MLNKKTLAITFLSAAVVIGVTTSMTTPKPQEPGFKNLKILPKDISKEDLDKVMHDWTSALGVRCGFCHARDAATGRNDFASDAKPEKEITRHMMTMTKDINEKYFKEDKDEKGASIAAVKCYTCHHGSPHPEANAAPGAGGQRGPVGPPGGLPGGNGGTPPPAGGNGGGTPPPAQR